MVAQIANSVYNPAKILLFAASCLSSRVVDVSSAACQDEEAPPDPMAPVMAWRLWDLF